MKSLLRDTSWPFSELNVWGEKVTMHCVENKMWRVIEVATDLLLHTVTYVQVNQVIEKVDCEVQGFMRVDSPERNMPFPRKSSYDILIQNYK